jgi:hypothetical protein
MMRQCYDHRMRTTIYLDDHLITRIKELAARTGRTMTAVIEDAVRQSLEHAPSRTRKTVRLTTVGGKGLKKGVDLDDAASLLDLMERSR